METHTTRHELRFIARLGSHARERSDPIAQADLLRGYIAGLLVRHEWGTLDRFTIREAAEARLRAVERRVARETS